MDSVLESNGARIVDCSSGRELVGRQLSDAVGAAARGMEKAPAGVVLLGMADDVSSVVRYLAGWRSGRPMLLVPSGAPAGFVKDMLRRFEPSLVLGLTGPGAERPYGLGGGYRQVDMRGLGDGWVRRSAANLEPHVDLGLLLSTSGTTGRPKYVRLSWEAVFENAKAIVKALDIGHGESGPLCLPLSHSYGLSILNSHMVAGATVLVSMGSVLSRDFWRRAGVFGATSLSGVPLFYEMLDRAHWSPSRFPRIRSVTQAGGRLRREVVLRLHSRMREVEGRVYVMYGQTEASARMSVLPPEVLAKRPESVGLPISGGSFRIEPNSSGFGRQGEVVGEVVYRGPGVMMGYASSGDDLGRGDDCPEGLMTGDIGFLDSEGFLYLTGRARRIVKIAGRRVALDEIERQIEAVCADVAVVEASDRLVLWCAANLESSYRAVVLELERMEKESVDSVRIDACRIGEIPRLPGGKVDYEWLKYLAELRFRMW